MQWVFEVLNVIPDYGIAFLGDKESGNCVRNRQKLDGLIMFNGSSLVTDLTYCLDASHQFERISVTAYIQEKLGVRSAYWLCVVNVNKCLKCSFKGLCKKTIFTDEWHYEW